MQLRGPCPNISRPNLFGAFSGAKFSGSKTSGFLKFFLSLSVLFHQLSQVLGKFILILQTIDFLQRF
jgi:hypothetical protein